MENDKKEYKSPYSKKLALCLLTLLAEGKAQKVTKQTENHQSTLRNVQDEAQATSTVKHVTDWLGSLAIQSQDSYLVRLPLELRQKIYTYLLDAKYTRSKRTFVYNPRIHNGQLSLVTTAAPFKLCTAILRVNKQIYSECISTLYRSNLPIRLSLYNDDIYWTQ